MHTHKFIFTYEGRAICEEPSCNYRFTLSEIKEILANIANEPSAEQPLAPDAVCVCGNTAFYEDKVLGVVCTHCQAPRS